MVRHLLANLHIKTNLYFFSLGSGGCFFLAYVGNGYCDDETNNQDCNYDGGDCCGSIVNTEYCSECQCFSLISFPPTPPTPPTFPPWTTNIGGCANQHWAGDGWCDDGTNNQECNYDGGDCCGSNVNTEYCSECQCFTV